MPNHPESSWSDVDRAASVARVLVLRMIWGLCLAVAAMVTGVGMELYASGAGRGTSLAVVVAGVLLVPLSSALIERLFEPARTSD
jgi:hypothetical protein